MITHHGLEKTFSFNESDEKAILFSLEQAQIHAFCVKKRCRKRGRKSGILLRIRRRVSKLPMPSKIDDLLLRLSYQWDIKNCNILCFTETWLNEETDNIELAGFSTHR